MSGDSRDLRLGSLESGFAADGSEKLPDLSEHKNLAAEVLSKVPGLYDRLKDRKTKLGITLARCIKAAVDTPDSPDACLFAGDEDCFEDFAEVFDVVIARMHGLLPPGEVNCTVRPQHPAAQPVKPAGAKLDVSARILHSVQLRAARNIRGFRFCPAMDRNERAEVEMLVAKALRGLAPAVSGVYLPLRQSVSYAPRAGGMDEFEELRLKAAGLHFELPESQPVLASGTCGEWPHGRGVFASSDRKLAVWINHQEHLTLMMVGDDMYQAYRDLQRALQGLGEILRRRKPGQTQAFASSERLGFLTSNLYGLGCSLQASAILKLPRLAAMEVSHPSSAAGSWRSWAGLMRVQVEPVSSLDGHAVEGCFKISNMDTFNVSDAEVLDVVHEVAGRLILAEQQITSLADSDALFPILTSVLSAAKEGRESRQSILSVISGVITDCGDNVAQDVVALLMKEQSRPGTQESIIEEDKEIADLKDRLKCAMYSKLQDGSLEEAIDTASTSGGAMHFSDLPPLPPPPEEMGRAAGAKAPAQFQPIQEVDEESFEENLSQLRHRTAGLLAQAADTGTLEKILGEVKKDMFVEVRKKVAGLLTEAANNGSLEKILEDVKDVNEEQPGVRQKAAELLSKAAQDGTLEKILSERLMQTQAPDVRQRAANLLTQAAQDGTLEKILLERSAQAPDIRQRAADLLTKAAEDGTLEKILLKRTQVPDIRQQAADLLTKAAEDGTLEKILLKRTQVPDIRQRTADLLTKAAQDGTLEKVLLKRTQAVDLRQRAAFLLSKAAEDGTLEKILAEKKAPALDASRARVAHLLSQAAEDGSLERILSEKAKSTSKDLRQTAASAAACLNQACQDGSLEKVLEQMAAAKEQSLDASRVAVAGLLGQAAEDGRLEQLLRSLQGEPMVYQDDVANIREAARESLLEAAFDGSLERVVSDLKIEKERQAKDGIRLKAAQLLEEAADSGALQRAVQEVKNDRSSGLSSRDKAAKLLEEAAESGQLQKVLQELSAGRASPRKETLAEVQKRTAHLLAQAADSGELERVLAKICPANEVELGIRSRVAQTLMEAAEDGRLHEALCNVRPQDRLAAVRSKVKQQLEEAALDGRLDKALQQLRQAWHTAPSVGTWYMAYTPFDPPAPAELEPSLRQRLAQTLTQAAENGELESALLAVQDEAAGDWRVRIRDGLVQSLHDGSLEKALSQSKEQDREEALRKRMQRNLLASLDNGSLEKALVGVTGQDDRTQRGSQDKAKTEAKQAAAEGRFSQGSKLSIEEFSAKMFLEAFSEKGRRVKALSTMIEEAELQIKHREQTCQQIQATVSQNKLELAHLELDLEWHQSALQGAEERRKELQNSQRKLLGTLHGKMYEISDVTGSPSAPSATMYPSSPGALHTPRRLEPMPPR